MGIIKVCYRGVLKKRPISVGIWISLILFGNWFHRKSKFNKQKCKPIRNLLNPHSYLVKWKKKTLTKLGYNGIHHYFQAKVTSNTEYSGISVTKNGAFFFKNWRIALQCCAGFCHTTIWICHKHTHDPFLLNLPHTPHPIPPLQVVTEHQVELPMSYSKFILGISKNFGGSENSCELSHLQHIKYIKMNWYPHLIKCI